jgi:hypothetical protein
MDARLYAWVNRDSIEYNFWDRVEFTFTDEDWDLVRWIWVLNASFWNYESCDFSIDNLKIITWPVYKELHIYRKDIIQYFITAWNFRGSPCKTLEEAKTHLKEARQQKIPWASSWHIENTLLEKF